MIIYEKLNNDNFDILNKLIKESKEEIQYQLNFYTYYDNKSFIYKFFIRKLVKLIKYEDKYIGYIWLDNSNLKSIRINDIYIKKEFLWLLNCDTLKELKSNLVIYETFENSYTCELINNLHMNRYKLTSLMFLNVEDYKNINKNKNKNLRFRKYNKKTDRKLRCMIQNAVFRNESRVPLTIADIEYDEAQEYYINDLCIFIEYNNTPIGYGQIVYNRGIYSAVNIGILEGYRGTGFGKELVNELIDIAKKRGIDKLYIRVECENVNAKRLYKSLGFVEIGNMSNWVWNKKVW